jgi:hypothetical protein
MVSPKLEALRHGGQPVSFALAASYFVLQSASQPSSAVSSASDPLARFSWHLPSQARSLATWEPTLLSHLKVAVSGGMKPVSSPPKAVCARGAGRQRAE